MGKKAYVLGFRTRLNVRVFDHPPHDPHMLTRVVLPSPHLPTLSPGPLTPLRSARRDHILHVFFQSALAAWRTYRRELGLRGLGDGTQGRCEVEYGVGTGDWGA